MKTFKQFLESHDPLESLQIELFFREELDLPKEEAKEATRWILGDVDAGDTETDAWSNIIDYVQETTGADIYNMPSGDIEDFVRVKLAIVMIKKYGIAI
jgi:hypothetical protein